jgi:hypothetical protein
VWAAVQKEMQNPLKTDKSQQFGGAQTAGEQQATARGLGLSKEDPPPSLVMMASSARSTLVATLDLIHKSPQKHKNDSCLLWLISLNAFEREVK